jgi:hypothetical protein
MTTYTSSYARALRSAPGPRAPVQALPLYHAPLFQENTIYVNLRWAAVDCTQKERDSFLKDDLGLQTEDVLDIFLDPSTLHLHLTLATSALFAEILGRLFAGVQWTAVGNFLVYGRAAAEPLASVHVIGVPRCFSTSQSSTRPYMVLSCQWSNPPPGPSSPWCEASSLRKCRGSPRPPV